MSLLYAPSGPARKYARLAANIYGTCSHQCGYCFCPGILRVTPEQFYDPAPKPRAAWNPAQLEREVRKWVEAHPGDRPHVHLCFIGDPLPMGGSPEPAIDAVNAIHVGGLPVQVLSKGVLPLSFIRMLAKDDKYGTTLTTMRSDEVVLVEPHAARPDTRLGNLVIAREYGIPYWLSLEPVVSLGGAMSVLEAVAREGLKPDLLWIGKLNHRSVNYDWTTVKAHLQREANKLGLTVRFKT